MVDLKIKSLQLQDEKSSTEEEHDRIRSLIQDVMNDLNEMDEMEDRSSLTAGTDLNNLLDLFLRVYSRLMTVAEFHSVADEIQ